MRCYSTERHAGRLLEWPSKMRDYDPVVVESLVAGHIGIRASCRERREAALILLERGQLSQRRIAEQVGVSKRVVERVSSSRRNR